ncbi:MAG: VTT domain-containing protein [Thermodesulfobacteriota bacterium]
MIQNRISIKLILVLAGAVCGLAAAVYLYRDFLGEFAVRYYALFTDREAVKNFITSFGVAAPLVFMTIQILQVIFAPIPGEVTGFIGGYLFGAAKGFLFSSLALTAGSWLNFSIGRFLGRRYVRKLIPGDVLERFDRVLKHQGVIVSFILFIIPGFPKDYLCLFLGFSTIPLKILIILAGVGRMPGTLLLSLQGAFVFTQNYWLFAFIFGLCLLAAFLGYRYREGIYGWVEKLNNR